MKKGCAESTNKSYSAAQKRFKFFCDSYNITWSTNLNLRAVERLLLQYVTWRAISSTVVASTIRNEIFGIRNLFVQHFNGWSVSNMASLKLLLKGIKRDKKHRKDTRKPITNDILRKIFSNLGNDIDNTLVKTVFLLAKSLMLRCDEYTIDNGQPIANQQILKWKHVSFLPSFKNPNKVVITISKSKTKQFTSQETGDICRCNDLCIVHLLKKWKQSCFSQGKGRNSDPLFTFTDGKILSRQRWGRIIKSQITQIGLSAKVYKPHSLRIGGACDYYARGISISVIKKLGRWESDAVLLYIRLEMKSVLLALRRLEDNLAVECEHSYSMGYKAR